jgi:hypothetical protein
VRCLYIGTSRTGIVLFVRSGTYRYEPKPIADNVNVGLDVCDNVVSRACALGAGWHLYRSYVDEAAADPTPSEGW